MKTENLTFIEAVQALRDGKCEGIAYASEEEIYRLIRGNRVIGRDDGFSPCGVNALLSPWWRLVNPIIPTEEREVKGWVCPKCQRVHNTAGACLDCGTSQIMPFSGTYTVPKVEREKRRASVNIVWRRLSEGSPVAPFCCEKDIFNWSSLVDKAGTLTFEWED